MQLLNLITVIEEMLHRESVNLDTAVLMRVQNIETPEGKGADLLRAQTAAEVWRAAIVMLSPLLK
jgi:hypothetical protein